MKHVLLFALVAWLFVLGSGVIIAGVIHGTALGFVPAVAGGSMLGLAVLLAIPLRIKSALDICTPYLGILKRKTDG